MEIRKKLRDLKSKANELLAAARESHPETTSVTSTVKSSEAPTSIKYDQGFLVKHYGPNRRQRRELAVLERKFTPGKDLSQLPQLSFKTRKAVRDFVQTAPSNFPIRMVLLGARNDPNYSKTIYLFEPEYREAIQKSREMFEAEEKVETQGTIQTQPEPAPFTPSLTPSHA